MFSEFTDLDTMLLITFILFAIGFLWHGPLFGKVWVKLSKIPATEIAKAKKKGFKGMWHLMALNFIGTFIMLYVLSGLISLLQITSPIQGAILGFWVWLGFFASTTILNSTLWEGKSWKLYSFNSIYWLVNLKIAGFLIVIWN